MPLSGWCSGIAGDQCHVNLCRSKTCECPRRQYHFYAEPVLRLVKPKEAEPEPERPRKLRGGR